jgi:GDP-L-fucose synthase
MDIEKARILITGAHGFVGGHLVTALIESGLRRENLVMPTIGEANLLDFAACLRVTRGVDLVIHAAALVGGIEFNRRNKGRLIFENLTMNLNMLEASRQNGVAKYLGVSSACAYPLKAPVPINEDSLFLGEPEPTNGAYGHAKRMMVVQANAYREQYGFNAVTVIPFNAFGPHDDFLSDDSHVIPALIRKCFTEKRLMVWGDGSPTRNFLYVKDLVKGLILAAIHLESGQPVNIGTEEELSIKETVEIIARESGFLGEIEFDPQKPNGQPRRAADISRAKELLHYAPDYTFRRGIRETIAWYRDHTEAGAKGAKR